MMWWTLAVVLFVASAGASLAASTVLVTRLERLCTRLGWSAALLGLLAALAADTPELTSAVTALSSGQHQVGTGVVLGSNVFNLAALIGLSAAVAGGIRLHPRVVILEGAVALWMAALALTAVTGLLGPWLALALASTALVPYVYIAAVHPTARSPTLAPGWLRSWLAEAVTEEEQEISPALDASKGRMGDAGAAVVALIIVLVASAVMERTASALGTHLRVPEVITGALVLAAVTSLPNAVAAIFLARRGRGAATLSEALNSNTINLFAGLLIPAVVIGAGDLSGALPLALWYAVLTLATLALAVTGRGVSRRGGLLIICAYAVFAATVAVTAPVRI